MSFVVTPGDTLTAIPVPLSQGGTSTNNAATARTNLGATTVGANLFTLTNPGAVTFPQLNADNTVSALGATAFRTAIGAGTGNGSVTSVAASAGTGISITGSPITGSGTLGITNTGVTQLTAGTGISVSGSTGNVTVSSTSSSPWVLISTANASSSSSLDFNSGITSTYRVYAVVFSNVVPSLNRVIEFRLSTNGGSSYLTTSYAVASTEFRNDSAAPPTDYYATGRARIELNYTATTGTTSNASSGGLSGFLYMYNPSSTSLQKYFFLQSSYTVNNSSNYAAWFQAIWTCGSLGTSACDAFQIRCDSGSGTLESGRVSLYGLST